MLRMPTDTSATMMTMTEQQPSRRKPSHRETYKKENHACTLVFSCRWNDAVAAASKRYARSVVSPSNVALKSAYKGERLTASRRFNSVADLRYFWRTTMKNPSRKGMLMTSQGMATQTKMTPARQNSAPWCVEQGRNGILERGIR